MSTTETRGGRVAPSKAEIDGARALAREVGLEYVDLDRYPLNAAAASLLPEQLARRHHALAVGWKYGTPVVAVSAPDNVLAMDDIKTVVGRDIHAVVACASQIDAYIERMYNQGAASSGARGGAEAPAAKAVPPAPPAAPPEPPEVVAEPPADAAPEPETAAAEEPEASPDEQAATAAGSDEAAPPKAATPAPPPPPPAWPKAT